MEFNESQMRAVAFGDGPMLVLAGPGSGKTTVLTHRIKYMTEELGISPRNILVITFTKAAASEMKSRFEALCPAAPGVTFGTFHSVFFWILRNAYKYTSANIASESEKYEAVRASIDRHGFRYDAQEDFAKNVVGEIGYVKCMLSGAGDYVSSSMKPEDFRVVCSDYERFLRSRGKLDFDDMLAFTYELLSQRQDILRMWQDKFRYILIDEFQNINEIQYETIKLLAGTARNVFAVGDDDQSIYGFRGAAPVFMKRFPEDFPGTRIECLNVNYRCSRDIVECSKRIIANNNDRYDKALVSAFGAAKCERVHVIEPENMTDQNNRIAKRIRELNRDGIPFSNMAVIYRTNTEPRALASKLTQSGIPFSMKDSVPNIFSHFLAECVFDYIKLARGCRDRAVVLRVINKPNRYISRDALDSATVDFEAVRQYYKDKYRIVNNINVLENDLKRIGTMSPFAAVNYIRKAVGLDAYVAEYAEYRGVSADDYVDILEEVQDSTRGYTSFDAWFEYIDDYTKKLREKNLRSHEFADSVTLTTMHSAKGLEYGYVFIVDAVEGMTPHKKAIKDEHIEEERRLFYVAVTRAKYGLYIYAPKKVYGKKGETSRFVREMAIDKNRLSPGNEIFHNKYGRGTITYADDKRLCVCFDGKDSVMTLNLKHVLENGLITHPLS